jgi:RNA polymerase sigma-70 factor (ECF subfamily)
MGRPVSVDVDLGSAVAGPAYVGEQFEVFYRRHYGAIIALAYALSGNRWAAEDFAQEAFVAAHRRWDAVSRYDHPEAFVRRVVANVAVSHARRITAEGRAIARLALSRQPRLGQLESGDDDFWRAVRALPRRQAQVVALYFLEDRSTDDIAHILSCSPATVRVHLHRGLTTLAQRLSLKEDASP